jgi:predicted transposase/invertase (TIGR01784 family)
LFGAEKHKKVLVCLLNAILNGKPHIKSITLLNPQHKKQRKDGKSTTLDIEAVTDDGTVVDIEIQCERDGNLVNRAFYHQTRIMKDELDSGESYDSCPDVISIWLTDYNETSRKHHTHEAVYMFRGNHLDGIEVATEKTRIFIIELPKIDLKKASINDMFMIWMFFLKNPALIPDEFVKKVPEVNTALKELRVMSMDDEFRAAYKAHIKTQNDRRSREANAEARGKEAGIAIGKEEGIAIGEAKGKEEGIREGELRKAREMALKLLRSDMDISVDDIMHISGLSIEEIEALKTQAK